MSLALARPYWSPTSSADRISDGGGDAGLTSIERLQYSINPLIARIHNNSPYPSAPFMKDSQIWWLLLHINNNAHESSAFEESKGNQSLAKRTASPNEHQIASSNLCNMSYHRNSVISCALLFVVMNTVWVSLTRSRSAKRLTKKIMLRSSWKVVTCFGFGQQRDRAHTWPRHDDACPIFGSATEN